MIYLLIWGIVLFLSVIYPLFFACKEFGRGKQITAIIATLVGVCGILTFIGMTGPIGSKTALALLAACFLVVTTFTFYRDNNCLKNVSEFSQFAIIIAYLFSSVAIGSDALNIKILNLSDDQTGSVLGGISSVIFGYGLFRIARKT